ncbi:hypothetical protein CRYUN_Cryun31cG0014300 [Craigia yunnanensis]
MPRQAYRNSSPFVRVFNAIAIQMNSSRGTRPPATTCRKTRRRRRCGGAPSTPLLHWTFYNNNDNNEKKKHHRSSSRTGVGDGAKVSGSRHLELSERKLAAGLWQLRLSAGLLLCRNGGFGSKLRSSDRLRFGIKSKVSFVSELQAELLQAQVYIHDLEYEVQSSRKNVKYLPRKLGEERTLQQKKEHDKIYALIDDLKGQLSRERKKQQRMDIINSQLIKELAEAKLSTMQLVQKYEEEKRTRELLEEVCNELAMQIGEDKAEVETLRIETMKFEKRRKKRELCHRWLRFGVKNMSK